MDADQLASMIVGYPQELVALTTKTDALKARRDEILAQLYIDKKSGTDEKDEPSLAEQVALLKIDLAAMSGKVELEFRESPPAGLKITESAVTAAVNSHPDVVDIKKMLIFKQAQLARNGSGDDDGLVDAPETPETLALRADLDQLETKERNLQLKMLELQTKFECYGLLVQLYAGNAGLATEKSSRRMS